MVRGRGLFLIFLIFLGLGIVGPCIEMDRVVLEMGFDSIEVPIDPVSTISDNVPHLMALLSEVGCNPLCVDIECVEKCRTLFVKFRNVRLS